MRTSLKNYLPASLLGLLGLVGAATLSAPANAAPQCAAPEREGAAVTADKDQAQEDERVYYVGCGGLY